MLAVSSDSCATPDTGSPNAYASSENPDDAKTIERTLKKLKVHDKLSALTLAMRHHGMLNDSVKISGSVETAVRYVANMPVRGSED